MMVFVVLWDGNCDVYGTLDALLEAYGDDHPGLEGAAGMAANAPGEAIPLGDELTLRYLTVRA